MTPAGGEGRTGFLVGDKTLAADVAKSVASRTMAPESGKAILTAMVGLEDAKAGEIVDASVRLAETNPPANAAAANDKPAENAGTVAGE